MQNILYFVCRKDRKPILILYLTGWCLIQAGSK